MRVFTTPRQGGGREGFGDRARTPRRAAVRRSAGPTSIGSQPAAIRSCRRARSRAVGQSPGVELVRVVLDRDRAHRGRRDRLDRRDGRHAQTLCCRTGSGSPAARIAWSSQRLHLALGRALLRGRGSEQLSQHRTTRPAWTGSAVERSRSSSSSVDQVPAGARSPVRARPFRRRYTAPRSNRVRAGVVVGIPSTTVMSRSDERLRLVHDQPVVSSSPPPGTGDLDQVPAPARAARAAPRPTDATPPHESRRPSTLRSRSPLPARRRAGHPVHALVKLDPPSDRLVADLSDDGSGLCRPRADRNTPWVCSAIRARVASVLMHGVRPRPGHPVLASLVPLQGSSDAKTVMGMGMRCARAWVRRVRCSFWWRRGSGGTRRRP